jgi:glutathione S-transferase
MYRLYWAAHTGAIAPQVLFEEAGVAYERVPIDMAAGEHHGPAYLAINPSGQVPALELPDGGIVTETAAMVLLLGERHGESELVPAIDSPQRPPFLRWLMYMATAVYMTLVRMHHPERFSTAPADMEPSRAGVVGALELQFDILAGAIAGDPWFLPRHYGALDLYLTMLVDWHPEKRSLLERHPALARLVRATETQPAFARVMAQHRG